MPKVKKQITVDAPIDIVYRAWRNFENFPRFMDNIEAVQVESETRSHWKAKGPLGTAAEWDAEITLDEPERAIAWRSIEGSSTKTAGLVSFGGHAVSTDIEVTLEYEAPGGMLGETVAKIFADPERQIVEDLALFKEIIERGVEMSALHLFDGSHGADALGSSMGATTEADLEALAGKSDGFAPGAVDARPEADGAADAKRILERNDQLVRGEVEASAAGEAEVGVGHMVNSDRSHVGGSAGNG